MNNAKEGRRNYCLDFAKGIACIFVVFMHCEFPGKMGILVQCVSRFCVPFFFMVSGYFCFRENGQTDYRNKIKHIGFLTIWACVFYFVVTPIYGGGFSLSLKSVLGWAVFNQPFYIAGQLWFLFALLYDYFLFAILEKVNLRKLAYFAIPIGIITYIIGAQGMYLLGYKVPNMYYRNFLIEGFPLFSLGFLIHEKKDHIPTTNKILIVGLFISTILCPVERILMGRDFGINIVTFVQVICLFILCVNNPEMGKGKLLNQLGSKYSLYVYILHPAIWHLLEKLYEYIGVDTNVVALYLLPIFCLSMSIATAVLYVYVYGMIKKYLRKERIRSWK